ncbi:MAG: hypothetical protein AABY84_02325 [Candidatus Firestonebacteria bacterium]
MLNKDYKEILQILLNNKVKFLIVGAYAMGAYGYPRATGDIDIWLEASIENSKKVYKSLFEFGAPLSQISKKTFCKKGVIFQIGMSPRRIDLITKIDGVSFKKAYSDKEKIEIEDITVPFLSKTNLIKNKKSTKREKDKLDVKYLQQTSLD